jgi:hypothetical protein
MKGQAEVFQARLQGLDPRGNHVHVRHERLDRRTHAPHLFAEAIHTHSHAVDLIGHRANALANVFK